jgi:ubiquinone/menaquinone biosynthesis C-methylase UbiE
MKDLKDQIEGFVGPTTLPDAEKAAVWQKINRQWWESHPMRYDWNTPIAVTEHTAAWFDEVDQRFFSSSRSYLPWKSKPFDQLIPFEDLRQKTVLEVGVGIGCHAALLSDVAKSFVGIDITEYATSSTRRRLRLAGLEGSIVRMDAENLALGDNTVDFVWSWGVIHHSADTRQALKEIHRVLKPGGRAVIMVYHRSVWHWWILGLGVRGLIRGELLARHSIHSVVQGATDGAIARYYKPDEWKRMCEPLFEVDVLRVYGPKTDLLPVPAGRFKDKVAEMLPDRFARLLCNRLGFGCFLVSELHKPMVATHFASSASQLQT